MIIERLVRWMIWNGIAEEVVAAKIMVEESRAEAMAKDAWERVWKRVERMEEGTERQRWQRYF